MIGQPGSGIIEVRIPELPPAVLPLVGNEIIELIQNGRSMKTFLNDVSGSLFKGWQFISQTTNASAGVSYAADTSAGGFTLTLPVPTLGNAVEIADPTGSWQTNNLIVARNGQTIEGLSEDMTMDLNRARIILAFDGSTWRVFGE